MRIGLISDTHNNIKMTKRACEIFIKKKVDIVIHAGDFTSPKIIALFKDFNCRFVLGNADIDIDLLNEECKKFGFDCFMENRELEIAGKKFLIIHGNVVPPFKEAVASGKYDYIIKGHTHSFENYIRNNTRIINPGSLFDSDQHSIAILDTDGDEVEKIDLDI